MPRTLYLHIGPPKTGTSALQTFLQWNTRNLAGHGFHYIQAFQSEFYAHNPLAFYLMYKTRDLLHSNNLYTDCFLDHRTIRSLRSELASLPSDRSIIVSSENFFFLSRDAIKYLLRLFQNMPAKVIVYIRDVYSQGTSCAKQVIEYLPNSTQDFRLNNIYDMISPQFLDKGIDIWAGEVGKDNMIFRKYGHTYFYGGTIFSDFLRVLGLRMDENWLLPEELVNISLRTCETIYTKDLLNRLNLPIDQLAISDQLHVWETSNQGTEFALPSNLSQRLRQESERIATYLLQHYLSDDFAPVLSAPPEPTDGDDHNYRLSLTSFIEILRYLDVNVDNFGDTFMRSLLSALDVAFETNRHVQIDILNDKHFKGETFEDVFSYLTWKEYVIALWGCGDLAEELFARYTFLKKKKFYLIDKSKEKQVTGFKGHRVYPPDCIIEKGISAVIITTLKYTEQVREEITTKYPSVKRIVKVVDMVSGLRR